MPPTAKQIEEAVGRLVSQSTEDIKRVKARAIALDALALVQACDAELQGRIELRSPEVDSGTDRHTFRVEEFDGREGVHGGSGRGACEAIRDGEQALLDKLNARKAARSQKRKRGEAGQTEEGQGS